MWVKLETLINDYLDSVTLDDLLRESCENAEKPIDKVGN